MIYIELRGRNIFCEGIKSMLDESLVNVIQENHIKKSIIERMKM